MGAAVTGSWSRARVRPPPTRWVAHRAPPPPLWSTRGCQPRKTARASGATWGSPCWTDVRLCVPICAASLWPLPDGGTGTWEEPHGRSVNGLPCPRRQEGPPAAQVPGQRPGMETPCPPWVSGSAALGSRCCHMSQAGAGAALVGIRDAGEDARRNSWYPRL